MKADKILIDDFRVSDVFAISDPFIEEDLKAALKTKGFDIDLGPKIISTTPIRAIRSDIAKKGDISILYDNETSFIGVVGKSFRQVTDQFEVLEGVLSELDPIMLSNKKYTELWLRSHIWTKKDPQKTIPEFLKDTKYDAFSAILGRKIRPFTIRVATEDQTIMDNPNWFDLRIEPLIRNPRYYRLDIVYRNNDKAVISKTIDNIEKIIHKVIATVEGE